LVIKDWKDSQKVEIVSVDAEVQDTPGFINIIPNDDGEEENEEHSDNVKKCEIIVDTIRTLPDKYKKVMIMREVEKMHYKDIAENIRKDEKIIVKNKRHRLLTPEDFYSLDLENKGDKEIAVHFYSKGKKGKNPTDEKVYVEIIKPHHSFFVLRKDIKWVRQPEDEFMIMADNSECHVSYVTTTNLSTIKSQIKKGRSLIQKKVARKFKLLGYTIPKVIKKTKNSPVIDKIDNKLKEIEMDTFVSDPNFLEIFEESVKIVN
jgi:hypothetical protein